MTGQAMVIDGGSTMHEPIWADRLALAESAPRPRRSRHRNVAP
jgi:hypothetical protein